MLTLWGGMIDRRSYFTGLARLSLTHRTLKLDLASLKAAQVDRSYSTLEGGSSVQEALLRIGVSPQCGFVGTLKWE